MNMAAFLTATALYVGMAFAAASSCPSQHATVTRTQSIPGQSTVSIIETVTPPADTWTRTLDSYNATTTVSASGDSPHTSIISLTDTTVTSVIPTTTTYTHVCGETITTSAESTSTIYTGSYSSDLAPYCSTSTHWEVTYLEGTTTTSRTSTSVLPISWMTEYNPQGTSTVSSYDSTPKSYLTHTKYENTIATATASDTCTSTIYTATASAAATQAAKCAPKNLIHNVEFINYRDSWEKMSQDYIRDGEAVKDASSCCQACQDDEECVAMQYNEGWQCALFRNKEDGECPLAFTVGKGRPGWGRYMVAAPGCGMIEEDGIDSYAF